MEITCTRCHQTILADNTYCPACGLPQLVCSAEGGTGTSVAEHLIEPVRDAGSVDWKAALRVVLMLAVPAGILSSEATPFGLLGMFWMAAAAALAVFLYLRRQRPGWITMGAGARIGLVTGLLGGWLAFAISGSSLYMQRFVFHQADQIDGEWKTALVASQELTQQWMAGMSTPEMAHNRPRHRRGCFHRVAMRAGQPSDLPATRCSCCFLPWRAVHWERESWRERAGRRSRTWYEERSSSTSPQVAAD